MHVDVDAREEVTDAATRGGRLLLVSRLRRSLATFPQVLLTGSAILHRMPLLRVHLLMPSENVFLVEVASTHAARGSEHLLVN